MMRRIALVLAAGAAAWAMPAAAQTPVAPAPQAPQIAEAPRPPLPREVAELRAQDARVLTLGHRLVTGNAQLCENPTHSAGILLHDMRAYGEGEALRGILGLSGDIGVQALVPGGPAERAGLRVDDTVIAIGDLAMAEIGSEDDEPWERIEIVREHAERLLSETGALPLTVMRPQGPVTIAIPGVAACRSRFEIGDDSRAVADGHRVVIGASFAGIDYPDPLLAAVLAHELGHNLLRHRAYFDAQGSRKRKAVRLTEREADRLMPWVLANAGFDPHAAADFMRRWGPRHGGWIFRARSHDGWDERVEFIEEEIARMTALGSTDWARDFQREDLPGERDASRRAAR